MEDDFGFWEYLDNKHNWMGYLGMWCNIKIHYSTTRTNVNRQHEKSLYHMTNAIDQLIDKEFQPEILTTGERICNVF